MISIIKNVVVIDERGNEYEATYPKRARGLVKNGRARFIEENKICLLCPPKIKTEDSIVSETTKIKESDEQSIMLEENTKAIETLKDDISLTYILQQIEKIQSQTDYLYKAIETLKNDSDGGLGMGIGNIVEEREKTNRQLISFYEKIYGDLLQKEKTTDFFAEQKLIELKRMMELGVIPEEKYNAIADRFLSKYIE